MTPQPLTIWPKWAKNINIYEVNIRQYTDEGTFNAFAQHLERLKDMGVDVLWFMPVFPISKTKRKGSLGSYYAVSSYREINSEFGSKKDFKNLIKAIHKLGMRILIDWVPNHTGWDHEWIHKRTDFYTLNTDGNVSEPIDNQGRPLGWEDVADLNYDNTALRETMIADMLYCLTEYNLDGFRQDMAMLVPLDFWEEANRRLRAVNPNILLLAESENHEHTESGLFNLIYSWSLHHILNHIALGQKNASAIDEWYSHERPKLTQGAYIYFTSNHDENSWSGSEIERMGEAHQAFAVLITMLDGVPLIYSGQEEPMPQRLKFFDKDNIDFKHYAYSDFYKTLLTLKHQNKALWNSFYGAPILRIIPHDHIFAFQRILEDNKVTIIINLSQQYQSFQVDRDISGTEVFLQKPMTIHKGETLDMKPWTYLVIY